MIHLATFFPTTLSGWAAIAAALGATAAALLSLRNHASIAEVHVLVNSNLADIKAELVKVTAERDELDPGRANGPA